MKIKKTPEELIKGLNELISLINYYKEGINGDVNPYDAHSLKSQAVILEKINTLEEVLRLFGINSCEYTGNEVVLNKSNDDENNV